jgi:hypothetical protein
VIPTYRVTLDVVGGQAILDVPSYLGPDAAGRRAFWTAAALGWGDLHEIRVATVDLAPEQVPA